VRVRIKVLKEGIGSNKIGQEKREKKKKKELWEN
jgi:hypothetical protein